MIVREITHRDGVRTERLVDYKTGKVIAQFPPRERAADPWANYTSVSRGVPVSQMAQAEKLAAELGVPTRYEVRGPVALPRITSREHDRKWLRAHKWVSHDPGDRYPVPGDFAGDRR